MGGCAFIKLPKIKIKTGIKAVDNFGSAASKAVKSVGKGVEKVAQGKVSEGLGDIGQAAMRSGLDVATGGNKKLVDSLSGGLMTSAEGAARGNSKDIIKTGLTATGIVLGVNALGGALNPTGAARGPASLVEGDTGMFDKLFDNVDVGGILTNLVNSKINPQTSQGNALQLQQLQQQQQLQSSLANSQMQSKMLMGGLGVLGLGMIVMLAMKKR